MWTKSKHRSIYACSETFWYFFFGKAKERHKRKGIEYTRHPYCERIRCLGPRPAAVSPFHLFASFLYPLHTEPVRCSFAFRPTSSNFDQIVLTTTLQTMIFDRFVDCVLDGQHRCASLLQHFHVKLFSGLVGSMLELKMIPWSRMLRTVTLSPLTHSLWLYLAIVFVVVVLKSVHCHDYWCCDNVYMETAAAVSPTASNWANA